MDIIVTRMSQFIQTSLVVRLRQARRARQDFSGFRGAALNQSRSASGVYTGLVSCHERGYQESTWRVCYAAPVRKVAYAGNAVITPPRSLGRYAPAVRLRRALPSLTEQAQALSIDSGDKAPQDICAKKRNPEKAAPEALFP
ncbi:hypothetical protein AHX68_21515 [Salmonella enterica subsp. enterica serovar Muenchen]|nr:hypothetical protein [Salmonella enterica subsp. enterica serovar Muenchen]EBZ6075030.1 hypothetical protein [Salmonella enterica subsp. enterica serovar Weslaco]EDQ9741506.1 hypothetical protein [Salmonella enterica subsp. enterica serovar Oranienburg]EEG6289812.1 hypothetical protein [Salmonella enterica subsp. enterica]EEJ6747561.1 hypothetical protein [Salmonella enterica subsp. enterica serovar Oslo]